MKKNFALVLALTITLSTTAPAFAFDRDGGSGRELTPIQRIVKIIKKLLSPTPFDGITEPHP